MKKRLALFATALILGGLDATYQQASKADTLTNPRILQALFDAEEVGAGLSAEGNGVSGPEMIEFGRENAEALTRNLELIQAEHERIDDNTGDIDINEANINTNTSDIGTNTTSIGTNTSGVSANSSALSKLKNIVDIDNIKDQILAPNGIVIGGKNLITRDDDGVVSIGVNSIKFVEQDGVELMYARDADGNAIPINVTNGTDLQINGVSVQGQIDDNADDIEANTKAIVNNSSAIISNQKAIDSVQDNVNDLGFGVAGATALSTAMSALPTVAQDSPLSCGVGTGGYSSRFAMSVGCAVKANDRLSINAGGSYVFGGAADYGNGSLSSAAARAGFVFKFGNLDTPAASNEQLQSQLDDVQEENAIIRDENASIKEQNQELLARLERLEAIALGNQPAEKTVSLK